MLTGVARTNWAARSSQWKSGRLRIISSTGSPAATPSASSPGPPAQRGRGLEAVQTCQPSPLRACNIGESGCAAASSRKRSRHRHAGDAGIDLCRSSTASSVPVSHAADTVRHGARPRLPVTCRRRLGSKLSRVRSAVIVDAVRTPLGKRNGRLREWHPVDLAAELLNAVRDRNDLDPAVVDDVVLGCVMQVGEQAVNVARNAVLAAGWPDTVPGTTIDRQCGSSQQAAHFAAQGVIAGAYDVVVAGGVEVMTRVPMGASMADGKFGYPFGPRSSARYADQGGIVPQGISAELIADKWGITREAMDAFGAALAAARGRSRRRGPLRPRDRRRARGRWQVDG